MIRNQFLRESIEEQRVTALMQGGDFVCRRIEQCAGTKYLPLYDYEDIPGELLYRVDDSEVCSGENIDALCRAFGISEETYRAYKGSRMCAKAIAEPQDWEGGFPNRVNRSFQCGKENEKWVIGVGTYPTVENGPLYMCAVLDLYDRSAVGYSFGGFFSVQLAAFALDMAFARKGVEGPVILHCSRNPIYHTRMYARIVAGYPILPSMTSKWEKGGIAPVSTFFSGMKRRMGSYVPKDWQEACDWLEKEMFLYNFSHNPMF